MRFLCCCFVHFVCFWLLQAHSEDQYFTIQFHDLSSFMSEVREVTGLDLTVVSLCNCVDRLLVLLKVVELYYMVVYQLMLC